MEELFFHAFFKGVYPVLLLEYPEIVIYRYRSFILSHISQFFGESKNLHVKRQNDSSILKYSGIAGKYVSILGNLKLPILTVVLAVAFRA